MPLAALNGTTWTRRTARTGFPMLVEAARENRPITYGELDAEIVRRGLGHHVFLPQYGYPLGAIGDACIEYFEQTGLRVPPINLLVINETSRLPGKGANKYVRRFCREVLGRNVNPRTLPRKKKVAIIDQIHRRIFDFEKWNEVLRAYGLQLPGPMKVPPRARRKPKPKGWNTGPESEAHKRLRELVAKNSELIGLKKGLIGKTERLLWSGDRVDVLFDNVPCAVEVKARDASWDEIHRGIFQCIKYRETIRAQQLYKKEIPDADCVLAIGGVMPVELLRFAALLRIQVYQGLA